MGAQARAEALDRRAQRTARGGHTRLRAPHREAPARRVEPRQDGRPHRPLQRVHAQDRPQLLACLRDQPREWRVGADHCGRATGMSAPPEPRVQRGAAPLFSTSSPTSLALTTEPRAQPYLCVVFVVPPWPAEAVSAPTRTAVATRSARPAGTVGGVL